MVNLQLFKIFFWLFDVLQVTNFRETKENGQNTKFIEPLQSTFFFLKLKSKGNLFEKNITHKENFIKCLERFNNTFFSSPIKSNSELISKALDFSTLGFDEIAKRDFLKSFHLKFYKKDLINHFSFNDKASKFTFSLNTPELSDLSWIQEVQTMNNLSMFPEVKEILVISEKIKNKSKNEIKDSFETTKQNMPDFLVNFESSESRYIRKTWES